MPLCAFVLRPPAVQLHLCADGRHAVRSILAGRPVLLGAAPAAVGHRLRGSAAQRPHPALQPEAAQTGRSMSERTRHRQEISVTFCRTNGFVLVFRCLLLRRANVFKVATFQENVSVSISGALFSSGAPRPSAGITQKGI